MLSFCTGSPGDLEVGKSTKTHQLAGLRLDTRVKKNFWTCLVAYLNLTNVAALP